MPPTPRICVFSSVCLCLALTPILSQGAGPSTSTVNFNRDIRPILSDNCFTCHGPDAAKRKAKLRLDTRDGLRVVNEGRPFESELFQRIVAEDDSERMPPPGSGKRLSSAQVEKIKLWIEAGARWQSHWSLEPPIRPEPPAIQHAEPAGSPIDRFILARLQRERISPAPEADRVTLVRRLSFDLTGLPPRVEEVDAFTVDRSVNAYEKVVDRLLASPHFGERLAQHWLDWVRYADTVGYHGDQDRPIAAYRDYVIRAFNANLSFDQFTIEQLAGDLLPNPTLWQKVASGYNMLGMTTIEGGAQPGEYLAKYAADRVRNVSTVWMAATLGCAECHDHKFDPYSTRDFYRFAAFFADLREKGVYDPIADLYLSSPDKTEQLARLDRDIARLQAEPDRKKHAAELTAMTARKKSLLTGVRQTIQSVAVTPREMRVLKRGDWMDALGEVVTPAVPAVMKQIDRPPGRATRLDLAHWLVSRDQPQTARVFVNRIWKLLFGAGLFPMLDDTGAQAGGPTHEKLLDWLAVEFVESGWDVKHLIRTIVLSQAYRRSSLVSPTAAEEDPTNLFLARQGRFRLDAEAVRDNALSISGLLIRQVGGDSVKPYQPAGYYQYLNFPKRDYRSDVGEKQYRRGVYTHWQRTFLHPALLAFDAPSREEGCVERPISNTPQAALVLLNDPSFVEAARVFAARIVREGGVDVDGRIRWAWRQALTRQPTAAEVARLAELFEAHSRHYQANPQAARELLGVGLAPAAMDSSAQELAAWTSVARALLNVSETITRN